jgi:hypothetical protein
LVENWFSGSVRAPPGTQYFLHISSLTGRRLSADVFLSINILSLTGLCLRRFAGDATLIRGQKTSKYIVLFDPVWIFNH